MSDTVACRICLEDDGILISPCGCKGSAGKVHEKCLKKWVSESGSEICEICQEEYARHEVIGCNVENYCHGMTCDSFEAVREIKRRIDHSEVDIVSEHFDV